MPKLNVVLMGVLTAAILAVTGLLVLRAPASEERASAKVERLLRKLADSDSDQRREGEDGLRKMGPEALPQLRQASTSADRVLAGRAAKLLQEFLESPVPAERPGTSAD